MGYEMQEVSFNLNIGMDSRAVEQKQEVGMWHKYKVSFFMKLPKTPDREMCFTSVNIEKDGGEAPLIPTFIQEAK